jgi:hypothetical protein
MDYGGEMSQYGGSTPWSFMESYFRFFFYVIFKLHNSA